MLQYNYQIENSFELDTNRPSSTYVYQIMHMDRLVAEISSAGDADIIDGQFMPFDLYLDIDTDIDTRANNLDNFYHWCASRILTLDRKYAKEILNTIGARQSFTDRDRAVIALSYHCVSLTDVYWVKTAAESISFSELNLYDNKLNEAIIDISLKGKNLTATNHELTVQDFAPDLSTHGCFPKAWIRSNDGFILLKDGGNQTVRQEVLASEICQCFDIPQVRYWITEYDGQSVSACRILTSKQYSMIPFSAFEIYAINNDFDAIDACIQLDPITYYGMNILDYLVGNTDRHWENWGLLVDNTTNRPVSLHPLMDFNQSFLAYDTIDGSKCLTCKKNMSQREAAIEAVQHIGLRQAQEIDIRKFTGMEIESQMFLRRLEVLKKYTNPQNGR